MVCLSFHLKWMVTHAAGCLMKIQVLRSLLLWFAIYEAFNFTEAPDFE